MLGYFKYGEFLLDELQRADGGARRRTTSRAQLDIVLPVGISFYTFATMSYTLDVYLRRAQPATQLPRLRAVRDVLPAPGRRADHAPDRARAAVRTSRAARAADQLRFGLALMTLGLFQKIVLADGFLAHGRRHGVTTATTAPGALDAWIGTLAFSGQIFCDFAGYSTTAIGAAMCLGFAMPDNFRFPYAAIGFSDFWRRWHITLSTWLRDYLYIPLGGNRHGEARTYLGADGDDAARRPVARRQLDVRRLGRAARPVPAGRARAAHALRRLPPGSARRCSCSAC